LFHCLHLLDAVAWLYHSRDRTGRWINLVGKLRDFNLTGETTAYQDLIAAVQGLSVTTDNPFVGSLQIFYRGGDNAVYSREYRPVAGRTSRA
jgi:hypothetical protein